MPCISFAVCAVLPSLVNRCICLSMNTSSAHRSTNNSAASGSVMLKFTKSALRSKMSLSSFRHNMPANNGRRRDEKQTFSRTRGYSLQGIHRRLAGPDDAFLHVFPPLIEMVAFGYALDNDVKHMAMIILD